MYRVRFQVWHCDTRDSRQDATHGTLARMRVLTPSTSSNTIHPPPPPSLPGNSPPSKRLGGGLCLLHGDKTSAWLPLDAGLQASVEMPGASPRRIASVGNLSTRKRTGFKKAWPGVNDSGHCREGK